MLKTSYDIEQEFVQGLRSRTGQDLNFWLKAAEDTGHHSKTELTKFMKLNYGWCHLHAALLAGIIQNGGRPVYGAQSVTSQQ